MTIIMGLPRTINLTRASEGNHLEEVLKLPFNYDEHISNRCAVKRQYFEQKQQAEKVFADKFNKINEGILQGIIKFVEGSLNVHGDHLFGATEAESIYGTILNLDMQMSDHEPTFNLIESSLKKFRYLNVTRVKVSMIKKRSLLEVLEPTRQSKRVLIMIEQAETLTRSVTDMLVGHLQNRIADVLSPTTVIMVLFCISTHIQELPFDHVNCFGRMSTIEKNQKVQQEEVLDELLRGRGIKMKLSHAPLDYIYEYFSNVDASLSSVVYMYSHAMFEYYHVLEDLYEDMNGYTRSAFLATGTKADRHQYICDQLYYFNDLLHEEGLYPCDVTELYEDLIKHKALTQSVGFIDAVEGLRKITQEAILRRIDKVIERSKTMVKTKNGKVDVISILSKYKDKLLNNKDCDQIVEQLINELLLYAQDLQNPTTMDKGRSYFNDLKRLTASTLTAVRHGESLLKYFCQERTYFGILLKNHILTSQGQIGVYDLAGDVADDFKEIIRSERSIVVKKGPRTKFTPRKRGGRVMKVPDRDVEQPQRSLSAEDEDGLVKALFVDVIDCMEHQYMIKLDPKARGKHLRRLVWPYCNERE